MFDNLPAHRVTGLTKPVEAREVSLIYFSHYFIDFKLIMLNSSKFKLWLLTTKNRTWESQLSITQASIKRIGEQDARG
jgi:hypothetical protein